MIVLLLAVAACAGVLVEVVLPGRAVYHTGWYNVVLAALLALSVARSRRMARKVLPNARTGMVIALVGVGIIVGAGVVNGLLAPDSRTVVGAPGTSVRVDDLDGVLRFPLALGEGPVQLVRAHRTLDLVGTRDLGAFIARPVPRTVVAIVASDAQGRHLTVTQPTGSAFLSPVLLMQNRQMIGGLDVPYDSFAVPTAHRIMKAVLFTPQQASQMRGFSGPPSAAVLFAADDDADQPIPNALALARDGATVRVGGLVLQPSVSSYPSVELIAVPSLAALLCGIIAVAVGGLLVFRTNRFVSTRTAEVS